MKGFIDQPDMFLYLCAVSLQLKVRNFAFKKQIPGPPLGLKRPNMPEAKELSLLCFQYLFLL